jgi:UDP-N-acetylmuramoyl-L-alanyl-D-glutamate--2,6-diaminopimelate ligase
MQVVTTAAQAAAQRPLVVVDFAHTPDGLSQALQALRPVAIERSGALHVVFGCGGNRDATKRPAMGTIAQQHADRITITNDNPRDEDAADIAAHIAAAAPDARIELDRRAAITHAIQNARSGDVVLIAGKGHEITQTVAGLVTAFSDVAQAQAVLEALEVRS